jgi:hypothetical protein
VGEFKFSNRLLRFSPSIPTDVVSESEEPTHFRLEQNYPNPFNPSTTIRFSIPRRGKVALKVLDVLGREVATLVNEELNAGELSAVFSPRGLSSGVYFYRLVHPNFFQTKAMVLVK